MTEDTVKIDAGEVIGKGFDATKFNDAMGALMDGKSIKVTFEGRERTITFSQIGGKTYAQVDQYVIAFAEQLRWDVRQGRA